MLALQLANPAENWFYPQFSTHDYTENDHFDAHDHQLYLLLSGFHAEGVRFSLISIDMFEVR